MKKAVIFILMFSFALCAKAAENKGYKLYVSEITGQTYVYTADAENISLPEDISGYPIIEKWKKYNENGVIYEIIEQDNGLAPYAYIYGLDDEAAAAEEFKLPRYLGGFKVVRCQYDWCENCNFKTLDLSEYTDTLPGNVLDNKNCRKLILSENLTTIPDSVINSPLDCVETDLRKAEDGEILLPKALTYLGNWNFSESTAKKVTFSESLEAIGRNVFDGCDSIKSVKLPKNLKEIDSRAFMECKSLEKYEIDEYAPYFSCEDGILYNKDKSTLLAYPSGKKEREVHIPDSVETIAVCAFYNTNVEEVYANCVKTVEDEVFRESKLLSAAQLGDKLETIGQYAFVGTAIREIHLPYTLQKIKFRAFSECGSLSLIEIEEGAPVIIESDAFYNINPEADIFLPNSLAPLNKIIFCRSTAYMHGGVSYEDGDFKNIRLWVKGGGIGEKEVRELSEKIGIKYSVKTEIYLNGEKLSTKQRAILENGRVFLPVRALGEALGASVSWDDERKTAVIEKSGKVVEAKIGESAIYVNGEKIETDAALFIEHGSTMAPLRAICEALDCNVSWDNTDKAAWISQNNK